MASAEVLMNSGPSPQRIRFSVIGDLKQFNGRDRDEDRARSWISKVKSAFLTDQISDEEKYLVFGDLLTGPAQNWHSQLVAPLVARGKICWKVSWCNMEDIVYPMPDSITTRANDRMKPRWSICTD